MASSVSLVRKHWGYKNKSGYTLCWERGWVLLLSERGGAWFLLASFTSSRHSPEDEDCSSLGLGVFFAKFFNATAGRECTEFSTSFTASRGSSEFDDCLSLWRRIFVGRCFTARAGRDSTVFSELARPSWPPDALWRSSHPEVRYESRNNICAILPRFTSKACTES